MQFNVSQLLREPVGATRKYTLPPEDPVHSGEVELVRMPHGVLVRADLQVVIEGECSRCLVEFGYPRRVQFEEMFYQQVDVATGQKVETEADVDSFLIDTHHVIDISEAVRQYGVMAADMQPLCRPDCPGICPECGGDLTLTRCSCRENRIDPRWAALETLKQR